jgi:hypothetical protein
LSRKCVRMISPNGSGGLRMFPSICQKSIRLANSAEYAHVKPLS